MGKRFEILNIISENHLNEIGDFKNIELYDYGNVSGPYVDFKTDLGDEVSVIVNREPRAEPGINFPPAIFKDGKDQKFYNVEYTLESRSDQYRKSDFKYLIRVLATVTDIIMKMVDEYDRQAEEWNIQNIYYIFPASKLGHDVTDSQKGKLYSKILKNKLSNDYRMVDNLKYSGPAGNYDGFAITKK